MSKLPIKLEVENFSSVEWLGACNVDVETLALARTSFEEWCSNDDEDILFGIIWSSNPSET